MVFSCEARLWSLSDSYWAWDTSVIRWAHSGVVWSLYHIRRVLCRVWAWVCLDVPAREEVLTPTPLLGVWFGGLVQRERACFVMFIYLHDVPTYKHFFT